MSKIPRQNETEPADRQGTFPFHKTRIHPVPKVDPEPVPTFFWPMVLFLLSVSVALMCWGAYNSLPQLLSGAEKHLQRARLSPKFNPTSAEAPVVEIPELLPEPEPDTLTVVANATGEPPLLPPPTVEIALAKPMLVEPPPVLPPVDLPKVEPPQVEFPKVELPKIELPAPPPVPIPPPPPVMEQAKLTSPVQAEDNQPLVYRALPPGDTPMIGNWKTLALYSLMTATVVVQAPAPVAAQVKEEQLDSLKELLKKGFDGVAVDIGAVKSDLKKIREDIDVVKDDGIKQRLNLATANEKIKAMEAAMEKIKTELEILRTREPAVAKSGIDKESVDEIKTRLAAIELAISKLQPSTKRIALSPPSVPPPTTGRVMLVNMYPEDMLFIINQKSYRVLPGTTLPLENMPAGQMTYEVMSPTFGLRASNTVNLAANETFSLIAR